MWPKTGRSSKWKRQTFCDTWLDELDVGDLGWTSNSWISSSPPKNSWAGLIGWRTGWGAMGWAWGASQGGPGSSARNCCVAVLRCIKDNSSCSGPPLWCQLSEIDTASDSGSAWTTGNSSCKRCRGRKFQGTVCQEEKWTRGKTSQKVRFKSSCSITKCTSSAKRTVGLQLCALRTQTVSTFNALEVPTSCARWMAFWRAVQGARNVGSSKMECCHCISAISALVGQGPKQEYSRVTCCRPCQKAASMETRIRKWRPQHLRLAPPLPFVASWLAALRSLLCPSVPEGCWQL